MLQERTSPRRKDLKLFDEVAGGVNISKFMYVSTKPGERKSGRAAKMNTKPIPLDIAVLAEKQEDLAPYFTRDLLEEISGVDLERLRLYARCFIDDRKIRDKEDPLLLKKKITDLLKNSGDIFTKEELMEMLNSKA
jgi:hypothetical protein